MVSPLPSVVQLVRGGAMLTGGAVVQALAGFAAQIVLMRQLGPEDFGQFALVLAGCGLVQMLLSLRLNVQIIRAADHALDSATRDLYHAALCWETLAAALIALAWLYLSGLMSALSLILVLSLALGQWANQALSFWERSMPYGRLAAVETGSQLLGHILAVAMVLSGVGVLSLPLRELAVMVVKIALLARMDAIGRPRWRWISGAEWRRLFRESRDVWCDGVIEGGFARLVVLASGWVGGVHGAGIFSQAMRLALVPHQFLAPVVSRLYGNLFARLADGRERLRLLVRVGSWTGLALAVGAGLAVALADPVVPWLFGSHWAEAARVLAAMAGLILFYSLFELLRTYCLSQRLTRYVLTARALQYVTFGVAGVAAVGAGVVELALGLSLSYAVAFGTVSLMVRGRATSPQAP